VTAALEVYASATPQKTLQHKFFIPDESNYKEDTYYQSASKLSVSHYIKQKEKQKLVTNFECDKRLNLPGLKDVDNYFQVSSRPGSVRDFFEVLFEGEWLRVAKCSRRIRFNSAMVCGRA
jgi:hypothetical protein